ncbi:predicted protein [Botrytis cinerea T4]|uniref:Uncharacterized protein n=1 Tax=Botryotinia fuckeliana (strain T4) TaxID=999810 RepID=G2YUS2_BOTF4|nr:predicted protein [Botrytis cinerea T4]
MFKYEHRRIVMKLEGLAANLQVEHYGCTFDKKRGRRHRMVVVAVSLLIQSIHS